MQHDRVSTAFFVGGDEKRIVYVGGVDLDGQIEAPHACDTGDESYAVPISKEIL